MTVDWRRRKVLFGGLLTVLSPGLCPCAAQAQVYSGCWIPESGAQTFVSNNQSGEALLDGVLVSKSGVEGLELALVQTLDLLSTMFGVLPGFSFYQEKAKPNAKATNHDLMKNRPDGTVLFGMRLLKQLLALPNYPDAAVVAVCAHEFAHILSYSNGMYVQMAPPGAASPFKAEQFADYMAGYFAGRRKLSDPNFPAVIFAHTTSLYGGGGHGAAQQRGDAVQAGFLAAYYRKLEPTQATQRAFAFALGEGA